MPFDFRHEAIPDVILVQPQVFKDGRGFFAEAFKRSDFSNAGIELPFLQDNHSFSHAGVLRGLHFQLPPVAQGKLVSVICGEVFDVAVDIRVGSNTFGKWVSAILSDENQSMLYIPPGFAHGFVALRDGTHLVYKCTAEYERPLEAGIRWDDPDLGIEWPGTDVTVSEKDRALPTLRQAKLFGSEGDPV